MQFKSYINNFQVPYLYIPTYGYLWVHYGMILPDALKCKCSWLLGGGCGFHFVLDSGVPTVSKTAKKIVMVKLVCNANWRPRHSKIKFYFLCHSRDWKIQISFFLFSRWKSYVQPLLIWKKNGPNCFEHVPLKTCVRSVWWSRGIRMLSIKSLISHFLFSLVSISFTHTFNILVA